MKACVLVTLKTKNVGNVRYDKDTIEYAHLTASGAERSVVETTKTIADPAEQDRAEKVRDRAKDHIRGLCTRSEHGLMCPLKDKAELEMRIEEAREWVADFNATAVRNHVKFNVICTEIQQDDVAATKAIFSDIEEFLDEAAQRLAELDVKKVRDIMDKAVNYNQVLDGQSSDTLDLVIRTARAACTRIVKAGNEVASEMERNTVRLIRSARTQFLDIDAPGTYTPPSSGGGRALDMVV
jgi:hypothetical protein